MPEEDPDPGPVCLCVVDGEHVLYFEDEVPEGAVLVAMMSWDQYVRIKAAGS